MERINRNNILEKSQYRLILFELMKSIPGLTLYELSYLLTKQPVKYRYAKIHEKFQNRKRKNFFKTRQRIQDCLTNLIKLNLVYKQGKTYVVNFYDIFLLLQEEYIKNQIILAEKELRKEFEKLKAEITLLNNKDKIEVLKGLSEQLKEQILNSIK